MANYIFNAVKFYDIYASFLQYFPGPHTQVYDILEEMRLFIARRVKQNQQTFDPNCPRDFIDCFLIQMEKVRKRIGQLKGGRIVDTF